MNKNLESDDWSPIWRPSISLILVAVLSALLMIGAFIALARADTPSTGPVPTPPTGERFEDMLCRMAVGNVQERLQDHFKLYVELYQQPDGTNKTASSYGLLTGTYYGPRGISHFGQDLDGPGNARYLKDGTPIMNKDTAHLRAITSEFRQGVCENRPEPTPQS